MISINDGNEDDGCQRTLPYSIGVESNKKLENKGDKDCHLHRDNTAIYSLSAVEYGFQMHRVSLRRKAAKTSSNRVNKDKKYRRADQGAGGPLIPDIGLEGGGPSDVGLNCLGLNQAGRL